MEIFRQVLLHSFNGDNEWHLVVELALGHEEFKTLLLV